VEAFFKFLKCSNSNIATGKFIMLIIMLPLRKTALQCVLFKDFNLSFSVLRRQDFVFMDDYLAEGLLRLCVHLVKVSSWLVTGISHVLKQPTCFLYSTYSVYLYFKSVSWSRGRACKNCIIYTYRCFSMESLGNLAAKPRKCLIKEKVTEIPEICSVLKCGMMDSAVL